MGGHCCQFGPPRVPRAKRWRLLAKARSPPFLDFLTAQEGCLVGVDIELTNYGLQDFNSAALLFSVEREGFETTWPKGLERPSI
jgi:hypothetical protein